MLQQIAPLIGGEDASAEFWILKGQFDEADKDDE